MGSVKESSVFSGSTESGQVNDEIQQLSEVVAKAEKEVEKAKSAVLSAKGPREQNLAMQALKLAEQKLNFQKSNFK